MTTQIASITTVTTEAALSIAEERDILDGTPEQKALYPVICDLFGLKRDGGFNEPIVPMGTTLTYRRERGGPRPIVSVTVPLTVVLEGDKATAFLKAIGAGR